jgi:hypothetical protein
MNIPSFFGLRLCAGSVFAGHGPNDHATSGGLHSPREHVLNPQGLYGPADRIRLCIRTIIPQVTLDVEVDCSY